MTTAELQAELGRIKAENAALRASRAKSSSISFRVSDKGALSVYGMGRFPVTLYREQWEKLLAHADALTLFISAHAGELTTKSPSSPPPSPSPSAPPAESEDQGPF